MAELYKCLALCCMGCIHYKGDTISITQLICWMNNNLFVDKDKDND